ncbi:MAG: DNA-directed DNA polymerase II small subunit [Methanolinea sp.]|nr:DNA-directed DNA polymerase II small subunit [Methanolinea sp.]
MLDAATIVQRFLQTKLQVHPEVVRYIAEKDDPGLIDRIIANVPGDTVVVSVRHIPGFSQERDGNRFLTDPECEVIRGAAGTSRGAAGVADYAAYFRDRYMRLGECIRARMAPMPIEALKKGARYRQEVCSIMGLVVENRQTANGHRMVEVEDPTSSIQVLFHKDRPQYADAETLVPDEVIGVRGTLSSDGRLFFAEQLFRPDIPLSHAPFRSERPGQAVLISDIHVGSNTFLEETWNRFADWLADAEVSYLLVAGDLVDGIGVYPNQERELTIKNIHEQYEVLGSMLRDLPRRMKIVVSPGNHDVVRQAEPQPAIPPEFAAKFPKNCILVENPAMVSLQGVRVLMYHGRSLDDYIGMLPGASYENAAPVMVGMLQRRHLAPTYGKRTPLAPGREDALVIDPIPEVLHCGHIHIAGVAEYRGVLCVNAGTWQGQTTFQKQVNITPTPGKAVLLDLQTLGYRLLDFT